MQQIPPLGIMAHRSFQHRTCLQHIPLAAATLKIERAATATAWPNEDSTLNLQISKTRPLTVLKSPHALPIKRMKTLSKKKNLKSIPVAGNFPPLPQ